MPKISYISASQVKPLMVNGKVREPFGAGAITYARLLARQMMGIEKEDFESKDIDRGNLLEDEAIEAFEAEFFTPVTRPGFLVHPEIEFFGGIPDGVTAQFGLDTKCPNQKNHNDNLIEGMQLSDYKHQLQSYMAITGLDTWYLVSYNPDFPDNLKLAVAKMERDQEYIDKLLERVKLFYPIVLEEVEKLKKYTPQL